LKLGQNEFRRSHHVEINLDQIHEALEASWHEKTSYQMALRKGNPAFGQCYPTSRIIQFFFPEVEIVEGEVWTGESIEKHFWNLLLTDGVERHIDLTWQQFPDGSEVRNWRVRERESLGDSQETIERVSLLFERVNRYISLKNQQAESTTSKQESHRSAHATAGNASV
jgi:hypothetical protein